MCHAADDLKIKGSIDMLSKVLYTRGRCDIGQVQVLHNSQLGMHLLLSTLPTICIEVLACRFSCLQKQFQAYIMLFVKI